MALLLESDAGLARPIGGIREHLETDLFAGHQLNTDRSIGSIGGRDLCRGDDAGVRFDRDVGLESVLAHCRRLVTMTGLGVHGRDLPLLRDTSRDAPGSFGLTGLVVLARA